MMITKVDHVTIAVKSIEDAVRFYTDVLGMEVRRIEVSEEHKTRTALIPVGEVRSLGRELSRIEPNLPARVFTFGG